MAFAVSYFPYTLTPMANIGPFTYADGTTYLGILEGMRKWLNESLVPDINGAMAGNIAEFQAGIANAEQAYTDFLANTTFQLAALNDAGVAANVAATSATRTALITLIESLAVLPAQLDALAAAKVGDAASATRIALDARYTTTTALTALANATVPLTQRGAVNGVATLDGTGKVPEAQLTAGSLSGTYSARPAANTVRDGVTYYSTDTAETYRNTAGSWQLVGKGGFLGSAALSVGFETNSTTLVDVSGLAVTFIAGNGPVKITFSGEADNTVNGGKVIGVVYVGSEDSGHINVPIDVANTPRDFTRVYTKTGLTPGGVYTAKVKIMASAVGGYAKLTGNTYTPTLLLVESL